jgi:hypothetical protein
MDATLLVPGDRVMSHCRYGYTCHHPVLLLRLYLPSSGTTFVPDKSDEVDVFFSSLSTLDAGSFHCFLMSTVVANRVEMNSFVNFALAICCRDLLPNAVADNSASYDTQHVCLVQNQAG